MSSSSVPRTLSPAPAAPPPPPSTRRMRPARCTGFVGPAVESASPGARAATLASSRGGTDSSLAICRVLNGMWQTSGGWGRIDRADAVDAMLAYADAGLSTFDMADHYGPAEDLYGMFINKVRRERPPEMLEEVRGLTKWVPPPVKMTRSFVEENINRSRKRMDVAALDMLQFHCIGAKQLSVSCTYFRRFYKEKPKGCLFVLTLLRNEFYDVRNKFQTMMHLEQQIAAYGPK